MQKLIIIRGPSAAGKSTIARELKMRSDRPTYLIEQDQIRPNFNEALPREKVPVWQILEAQIKIGLQAGCDVIIEGILNIQKSEHRQMFERIFDLHPDENYLFFLDVNLDETKKRHAMRPEKRDLFTAERLDDWYALATPFGHVDEVIIPKESTIDETVKKIAEVAGLKLSNHVILGS